MGVMSDSLSESALEPFSTLGRKSDALLLGRAVLVGKADCRDLTAALGKRFTMFGTNADATQLITATTAAGRR